MDTIVHNLKNFLEGLVGWSVGKEFAMLTGSSAGI